MLILMSARFREAARGAEVGGREDTVIRLKENENVGEGLKRWTRPSITNGLLRLCHATLGSLRSIQQSCNPKWADLKRKDSVHPWDGNVNTWLDRGRGLSEDVPHIQDSWF